MTRSIALGMAAALLAASVALAGGGRSAREVVLARAVDKTVHAASMRYVMDIAVIRRRYPATVLHIDGTRGTGQFLVHVKALAVVLADGTQIQGPEQSAMIDGPFLYEGAPSGVTVNGSIRWLRVPLATLGTASKTLAAMRNLSPAPLFHVLDESPLARTRTHTGVFRGTVAYDDRIVRTALTAMTGGIEFRSLHFEARVGDDGLVHRIKMTGRTADGTRSLSVSVRLYAFGRPVNLTPPAAGTFMDEKSLVLAD
jgi:hypothetical protein